MSEGPLVVGFSKSTQMQFLVFKDGFSITSRVPVDSVAVETETNICAIVVAVVIVVAARRRVSSRRSASELQLLSANLIACLFVCPSCRCRGSSCRHPKRINLEAKLRFRFPPKKSGTLIVFAWSLAAVSVSVSVRWRRRTCEAT